MRLTRPMLVLAASVLVSGISLGVGSAAGRSPAPSPAATAGGSSNTNNPSPSAAPNPGRVFVIMMENHGYDDLIGNPSAPWINTAAATYGLARQSFGVAHPSQPNYIAATSGDTQGVTNDDDVTLDVPNIVDQVEASGRTWTAYMQTLAACNGQVLRSFCGGQRYARKHDPFVSYQDVVSDPARLARVVDLTQLDTDLASGTVSDLTWISPDQCHDMHGLGAYGIDACGLPHDQQRVAAGDAFLARTVGSITASSAWTSGSVIFVTWDESGSNDTSGCCGAEPGGGHIVTLVISHDPGQRTSDMAYDHYSLLASIESVLGLGCLGNTCNASSVRSMSDLLGPSDSPSPRSPAPSAVVS